MLSKRVLWFVALVMVAGSPALNAVSAQGINESAREFVGGFYEWYLPRAIKDDSMSAGELVLKLRRSYLSDELATLLQADSDAQKNCSELVALDFDPFLSSQEATGQYVVGQVQQDAQHFQADVYHVLHGSRSKKPSVIVEFEHKNGRWFFTNFRYSDGPDLISLLRTKPPCTAPRAAQSRLR